MGSKEPSRQDFIDNPGRAPRPEFLRDWELGYQQSFSKFGFQLNAYWMQYVDQLVLTGALNAVGEAIRTNAPESYRLGVEASWNYQIHPRWLWQGNLTLSQNKIRNFTEYLTDYDTYEEKSIVHGLTAARLARVHHPDQRRAMRGAGLARQRHQRERPARTVDFG